MIQMIYWKFPKKITSNEIIINNNQRLRVIVKIKIFFMNLVHLKPKANLYALQMVTTLYNEEMMVYIIK